MGRQGNQVVGVWWTFDQNRVGLHFLERSYHAARRAWPVMTHAQDPYERTILHGLPALGRLRF